MPRVFVSYASGDHEIVQSEIVGLLKALRFGTWFAPDDIRTSEQWKESIASGLRNSDWFVVIVSTAAAASRWVKQEVRWALERRPNKVLPIVIDSCKVEAIDKRLRSIQYVDYGANRARATQQLLEKLVDAEYRGFQRDLAGKWLCAVQPVYYSLRRERFEESAAGKSMVLPARSATNGDWHVQKVEISRSSHGYVVDTVPAKGKLQWYWEATFEAGAFLAGPWRSKRKSSGSHGYMTVQLSRNGTYMFGHDYAVVLEEAKAHYGLLLFGRDKNCLNKAWSAMNCARRVMSPLKRTIDFPER